MREGVAVDELDRPLDQADDAAEDAEGAGGGGVALAGFRLLRDADGLPDHVDEGDDQGAEGDGAEGVG